MYSGSKCSSVNDENLLYKKLRYVLGVIQNCQCFHLWPKGLYAEHKTVILAINILKSSDFDIKMIPLMAAETVVDPSSSNKKQLTFGPITDRRGEEHTP